MIIVGSGLGGLSTGISLQSKNPDLKTLILEQHHEPGGFVSGFKRNGFYFDSGAEGIIQVGKEDGAIRELLEGLGFHHEYLRIDPIEVYHVNDKTFVMHADIEQFIDELVKRYPDEKEGIIAFIHVCKAMAREIIRLDLNISPKLSFFKLLKVIFKCPNLRKYGRLNFSDFFSKFLTNDEIKEYFKIYCAWAAVPFDQLRAPVGAFQIGATSLNGLHYPRGGMLAFARKFVEFFVSKGGTIKYRSKVQKILVEGKKAVGVQLEDDTIIHGDWIVSNADLKKTIFEYIGREHFPESFLKHIQSLKQSISGMSVFLGVDTDLSEYAPHISIGQYVENIRRVQNGEFKLNALVLRISSNVDPSLKKKGGSSVKLLTLAPYNWKDRWQTSPNGERTPAYCRLKEECAEKMIALAEKVIPRLSEHIVVKEIATPLTFERHTLATEGAWYGLAPKQKFPSFKSLIKGLLFVGSNVRGAGIPSAILSGIESARYILKRHKK